MAIYVESEEKIMDIFRRYCDNSTCDNCAFYNHADQWCLGDVSWDLVKREMAELGLITELVESPTDDTQCDMVYRPSHYTDGGIETIDYIRAKLSPEEFNGYCKGNCIKYLSRAGKKSANELEDYEKVGVYLNWLLDSTRRLGGVGNKKR